METQALSLIRLLLKLTQEKKVIWHQVNHDFWEAEVSAKRFTMEFIYLARTDETGSDRTLARVQVINTMFDYCIGTEGFELLCEMVSIGDTAWEDSRQRFQTQVHHAMTFLQNL